MKPHREYGSLICLKGHPIVGHNALRTRGTYVRCRECFNETVAKWSKRRRDQKKGEKR